MFHFYSKAIFNSHLFYMFIIILVHYILVNKCKKRLKKLNFWDEHFKGIHGKCVLKNCIPLQTLFWQSDKLSLASLPESDVYEQYKCAGRSSEQVVLSVDSDREENDEDEDSGLLDGFNSSPTLRPEDKGTASSTFASHCPSPNGTEDKDSGVDEAAGDSDTPPLDTDTLTAEEEEELYIVLRTVLDKCISHEVRSHRVYPSLLTPFSVGFLATSDTVQILASTTAMYDLCPAVHAK